MVGADVNSEGDFWPRQRRLIQEAFQQRRFGRYAETAVGLTRRRLDRWAAGAAINLDRKMSELALEVASETAEALRETVRAWVAAGSRQGSVFSEAERAGFEPAVGFDTHAALAKRCYRPLSHLSGVEGPSRAVLPHPQDT